MTQRRTTKLAAMKIDIWSDLVCPWCWIGTQRLYTALHALGDASSSIEIRWHPFQIDPTVGDTPVPLLDFYEQKFASRERGKQIIAQTQAAGRADGLPFDYERGQVRLNTRHAHRVVWLAGKEGDAAAVMRALFHAHFAEGRSLGDPQTLVDAGVAGGLSEVRVRAMLESDEGLAEIRTELSQALALGVHSVPTFVIDGKTGLQGAQPPEAFLEIFAKLGLNAVVSTP